MDIKGITWVGNIYQKFEAMCMEVEDVIYHDTAKYMENQAQRVGVCVKKFYSEVMEDLAPPSCVEAKKVSLVDLPLSPHCHTDINKDSLPRISESHVTRKKISEDGVISEGITGKEPFIAPSNVNVISMLSPGAFEHDRWHDSCSGRSKKLGAYRRKIGIKRISQDNHTSKDLSQTTSFSGNISTEPTSCDMTSSPITAFANINGMQSSNSDGIYGAVKENEPRTEGSVVLSDSKTNTLCDTLRQNKDECKCITTFQHDCPSESLLPKKGVSMSASSCDQLPTEYTGAFMNGSSFSKLDSSIKRDACNLEFGTESISNEGKSIQEDFLNTKDETMSDEDKLDAELIVNEEATGFEPIRDMNLDGSCVLVEGYQLHCDPWEPSKMSYKKTICKVLSSKLRSRRNHDHIFSIQQKDSGGKTSTDTSIPQDDEKMSSSRDDGWELV